MHYLKKVSTLFLLMLSFCLSLSAQTRKHPWQVGIHFGKAEFNGDIGDATINFSKAFYMYGGASFSRYASRSWDFTFIVNYGEIGYWADGDTVPSVSNFKFHSNIYANMYNGTVLTKYKFNNGYFLKENARFQPYLLFGFGIYWLQGERLFDFYAPRAPYRSSFTAKDLGVVSGVGVNVRINDRWGAHLQTQFIYTDHDSRDGYVIQNNDGYSLHRIGVTYNFGKPMKCDMECMPVLPAMAMHNCDRDSDGIVDQLDLCPDTPGVMEARGCPDRDWDGIPDKLDKCPDVWGTRRFEGCPDTDGDGIPDHLDSCVFVPGLVQFNGCPDFDNDGIPDHKDSCRALPGPKEFNGCPDTDHDSLPDNIDKCPRDPGPKWNKGCPEIKESVKKLFEQALTGVQFQTNKSIILPKSFPILDNVAKVMRENPTYFLVINGHTDNQGDDMKNMKLSDDRANAVRLYLIKKGTSAERLESHGFGETMPIDDNETPEGRARNRRVEFKVRFVQ
jgi:outer membrane protein OmpA-like peptidoglycan-associated protein